jgi:hypothetical protein
LNCVCPVFFWNISQKYLRHNCFYFHQFIVAFYFKTYMKLIAAFSGLAALGEAIKLQADPYVASDQNVRLAKQRLLSMDPNKPGIRYRLNDQLTNLMNMDQSIAKLEQSVNKFQSGLSQVAGIIDISKSTSDGLMPQMKMAIQEIARLDNKLKSLHRQAQSSINNLYNNAAKIPVQLTGNLQSTINNLVTMYNQQIINQVHTLDRQRKQAMDQVEQDTRQLNRTVATTQTQQMVDVRKLLKKIKTNRVDLLTQTADLTAKLAVASNIVNTALAGVKTKADQDMTQIQGIVNENKQTLTQYLADKGNEWTNQVQATIAKAAQQVTKSLAEMSKSLTDQFTASRKQATSDLAKVDSAVDAAVQTSGRSIEASRKQFDAAIKNATRFTDSALSDLSSPITEMRDQITAATNLIGQTQNEVTVGVQKISGNASRTTQDLVLEFQDATRSFATNPAFLNLSATASAVNEKAVAEMQAAELAAQTRVSGLEKQLGSNDQTLGSISSSLQESIDSQKRDFDTNTKLQSSEIQNKVDGTSSQLQAMAGENAALIDEAKANADSQLADATGRVMGSIRASHDSAAASLQAMSDRINQSSSQAQDMISAAFGSILSDSGSILKSTHALADAADIASTEVANISSALEAQGKFVDENVAAAANELGSLRDIGASAVDSFGDAAGATTAEAVGAFNNNANSLVSEFSKNMQTEIDELDATEKKLAEAQQKSEIQAAWTQAFLQANLTAAKELLNNLKANSTLTDAAIKSAVAQILSEFKQGALAEVSNLRASTGAQLQAVANELKNRVASAGDAVNEQTKGFFESLVALSHFVSDHSRDLDASVGSARSAVGDFRNLVDKMVFQISAMSDDLKLFYQNTTSFVSEKLDDTEQLLNESRSDALGKIQETWEQLRTAMENVDGSTSEKINRFRKSVNESIVVSDRTVANFTEYLDAMITYEKKSAAARLAIQRGILQSIMENAAKSASVGGRGASDEMIRRLRTVMSTAENAANASSAELAAQQAAQNALIDSFGLSTAAKVDALLRQLQGNTDAFISDVGRSSADASGDSQAMLRAAGLGVHGVVGLANNIAGSVEIALDDTQRRYRDSQVAMAALSAETSGLSNITESQLRAVIQAMMNSQNMFSSELDSARKNNSQSIALISGVIRDFVTLVNQTLAESDDLISAVDKNYTEASMKLGAKMDTILGFISRQASQVSESADGSARNLKALLTRNGAMQEGIQTRLKQLSTQQDAFAKSVHDQLQGFIARLNDDNSKLATGRQAATNKLYDALHTANTQFAANAAQWQSQRLATSLIEKRVETMSDEELVKDVEDHLRAVDVSI